MTIGFEVANLDAAVTEVVQMAVHVGQTELRNIDRSTQVDLNDREQVRQYLKDRAKARYSSEKLTAGGIQIARIEDVPYRGLGFVFEQQKGVVTHPPLERVDGDDDGEIEYCVVFWTNVSRWS
ncbi:hypothetical protein F4827_006589 [Paraburkholderia bannensis]|uniref:Uncharacterized protein n=1 Tax=Paraburkholderia bannensis TaxID=765414 RepID=A0A7W9U479_9BURK|nr:MULTISPECIES: hypothetical protein [Paraburkholderia]MBB3261665.1 hypothetical protein [Paraburkholderia sp. WP4_3_2]MBB6106713.1 hypothetical protein [Paraburkholderia bannensis]